MVGIELKGRLGNQFFHYAYARSVIYKRNNEDDLIISDWYLRNKPQNDGWENNLGDFNVYNFHKERKLLVLSYGNWITKVLFILYKIDFRYFAKSAKSALHRWKSVLNRNGVIISSSADLEDYLRIPNTKDVFIDGFFENPKLFNEIKGLLQIELTPRKPRLLENGYLYDIIDNNNSICVSIRRGDYLSTKYKDKFYVCTQDYFNKAIEIISRKVSNPVFIFFSDDILWVKNNIKISFPCYYETGDDPLWEKIRLMSSCKHFIISNSTFSWWAQYLCKNDNKIVISPSIWYNGYKSKLILDDFLTIDVSSESTTE